MRGTFALFVFTLIVIATGLAVYSALGIIRNSDDPAAGVAVTQFGSALKQHDGKTACGLLSQGTQSKLEDDRNLKGWLMTIAHRKAIDHHRRGKRERPVAEVPERPTNDGVPGGGGVWTAVAGLPPKQRTAVALRFACDMPHREIAAALGGSEDAARQSLHEGLKKLREVLT